MYIKFSSLKIACSTFSLPGTLVKGPINYTVQSVTGSEACAVITKNSQEFGLVLVEYLWCVIKYRIIGMLFVGQNCVNLYLTTLDKALYRTVSTVACMSWCCDLWKERPRYGRSILGAASVESSEAGMAYRDLQLKERKSFPCFSSILCRSCLCL